MRKTRKKKKPKPRIPIEAVLKLKTYATTTKKGKRGYNRKKAKVKILKEKILIK